MRSLPILILALLLAPRGLTAAPPGDAQKGWRVDDVQFSGVPEDLRDALARGLEFTGSARFLRTERPRFYPEILERDLRRIRVFLARRGFPDADVTADARLRPNDPSLALEFRVTVGEPYRVGELTLDPDPEESVAGLTLASSQRFEDRLVASSRDALRSWWIGRGHAEATARDSLAVRPEDRRVDVWLFAQPGPRYHFADVLVEGAQEDLVPLVKTAARIPRGEPYDPDRMTYAEANLRRLDLFRRIQLGPRPREGGELDVRAVVAPLPRRTLEFGVGVLTDDLFWGRARWLHRNLFRRGRGAELRGSATRFERKAGATAWWPALWGTPVRGQVSTGIEEQVEESYRVFTTSVGVGGRAHLTRRVTGFTQFSFSNVDLDEKTEDQDEFLEDGGLLAVTTFGLDRNTTNDALFPTRGTVSSVRVRIAPWETISRAQFVSSTLSGAWVTTVAPRVVMATRVEVSAAQTLDTSQDLLPNYRFYAGGANSMRGFRRRDLGPKDSEGDSVGGEASTVGAWELRLSLPWRLVVGGFVDAGQVWRHPEDARWDSLQWAAGPTLMVRTPVGPLRADLGFRLTDAPDSDPGPIFHFSIGQSF